MEGKTTTKQKEEQKKGKNPTQYKTWLYGKTQSLVHERHIR